MAVIASRCIARADCVSARPAGCRWAARWLAPAHRCPSCRRGHRGVESFGVQARCRAAPGAMGLDLPFLGPSAYGREPTRSHAVAPNRMARFARRGGRGGAIRIARRRPCRGSTTKKVTE